MTDNKALFDKHYAQREKARAKAASEHWQKQYDELKANPPRITEITLGFPRWFTNGQRWYTAWHPNGEVRVFPMIGDEPTPEEMAEQFSSGHPVEPYDAVVRHMVMMEAMITYFGTGEEIDTVTFTSGVPYSHRTWDIVFKVRLIKNDEGEVTAVDIGATCKHGRKILGEE